jgi:hypothetical protein
MLLPRARSTEELLRSGDCMPKELLRSRDCIPEELLRRRDCIPEEFLRGGGCILEEFLRRGDCIPEEFLRGGDCIPEEFLRGGDCIPVEFLRSGACIPWRTWFAIWRQYCLLCASACKTQNARCMLILHSCTRVILEVAEMLCHSMSSSGSGQGVAHHSCIEVGKLKHCVGS